MAAALAATLVECILGAANSMACVVYCVIFHETRASFHTCDDPDYEEHSSSVSYGRYRFISRRWICGVVHECIPRRSACGKRVYSLFSSAQL